MGLNVCSTFLRGTLEQVLAVVDLLDTQKSKYGGHYMECTGVPTMHEVEQAQALPYCHSVYVCGFWDFQDHDLAGGAIHITLCRGLIWVSRHSGYDWANLVPMVCDLLQSEGAVPVDGREQGLYNSNPQVYGMDRFVDDWERLLHKKFYRYEGD